MSRFAIVTRDELWSLDRRALIESRLMHGSAETRGDAIDARDDCDERRLDACESEARRVRDALRGLTEGRARFVVSARNDEPLATTISITVLDLSIVTTIEHLQADYELLVELASIRPQTSIDEKIPIVWRNGSGAVLLHEAAGHPAEHGHEPVRWPKWLSVHDGDSDLLAGEAPRAMRRQSFSDVPLRRMTNVVVSARSSKTLPKKRVDVFLVAGGRYEPLTEVVSLAISAADLVDGDDSIRLRPFAIEEPRASIARAIRGASGVTRRYPGVICTKEGQELFVGSHSPDLITEF